MDEQREKLITEYLQRHAMAAVIAKQTALDQNLIQAEIDEFKNQNFHQSIYGSIFRKKP